MRYIVHQVWIGDAEMPERLAGYCAGIKAAFPGWTYRIWREEDMSALAERAILPDVVSGALATNMGLRSDVVRLEILRQHGGVYFDTDFEALRLDLHPLFEGLEGFWYADEGPGAPTNAVMGAAEPGDPFVEFFLRRIAQGGALGAEGWDVIGATGPAALKATLNAWLDRQWHNPEPHIVGGQHVANTYWKNVTAFLRPVLLPYAMHEEAHFTFRPERYPEAWAAHHWEGSWFPGANDEALEVHRKRQAERERRQKLPVAFVEIGCADFDTLTGSREWEDFGGLVVEPVRYYLDRLPDHPRHIKVHAAIGREPGEVTMHYLRPELLADKSLGLDPLLRGCTMAGAVHPLLKEALAAAGIPESEGIVVETVEQLTFGQLAERYGIGELVALKIDAEGMDCEILESYLTHCHGHPECLAEWIQLETAWMGRSKQWFKFLHGFLDGYDRTFYEADARLTRRPRWPYYRVRKLPYRDEKVMLLESREKAAGRYARTW